MEVGHDKKGRINVMQPVKAPLGCIRQNKIRRSRRTNKKASIEVRLFSVILPKDGTLCAGAMHVFFIRQRGLQTLVAGLPSAMK